jgi:hypothetical protein
MSLKTNALSGPNIEHFVPNHKTVAIEQGYESHGCCCHLVYVQKAEWMFLLINMI